MNIQCGIEKAMSTVFPVLAGAVGIGTVGHLENAVTFSPLQLVIDNEVVRYMHRTLEPIPVNEDTLALETIRRVGAGGHYLEEAHTVNHFRDEIFFSDLFETMPWDSAHSQNTKGMENKAFEIARSIWEEEPEPVIDTDKIDAIDRVCAHAKKEFMG